MSIAEEFAKLMSGKHREKWAREASEREYCLICIKDIPAQLAILDWGLKVPVCQYCYDHVYETIGLFSGTIDIKDIKNTMRILK